MPAPARRRASRRAGRSRPPSSPTASVVKPTGTPPASRTTNARIPRRDRDAVLRVGERLLRGLVVLVAEVPLDAQRPRVAQRDLLDVRRAAGAGPSRSITALRSAIQPAAVEERPHAARRRASSSTSSLRWREPASSASAARHEVERFQIGRVALDADEVRVPEVGRRRRAQDRAVRPRLDHIALQAHPACAARRSRRRGADQSSASSSPPPARRITIWSSSIVISTGRWPAQCSA